MDIEGIKHYFPDLAPMQCEQLTELGRQYPAWNEKINVISRKDIDNLWERHILHSLAIARYLGTPVAGTRFLDLGTGGGFPAIPLAVLWPQCHFHLLDRIAKKLTVAQAVATAAGLENVSFQHGDIGECRTRFDYVVCRGVMPLEQLIPLVRRNIAPASLNAVPNGLICLKGGDLQAEIQAAESLPMHPKVYTQRLSAYFTQPFFATKQLVYVPMR